VLLLAESRDHWIFEFGQVRDISPKKEGGKNKAFVLYAYTHSMRRQSASKGVGRQQNHLLPTASRKKRISVVKSFLPVKIYHEPIPVVGPAVDKH
jgi:hypothetical protein